MLGEVASGQCIVWSGSCIEIEFVDLVVVVEDVFWGSPGFVLAGEQVLPCVSASLLVFFHLRFRPLSYTALEIRDLLPLRSIFQWVHLPALSFLRWYCTLRGFLFVIAFLFGLAGLFFLLELVSTSVYVSIQTWAPQLNGLEGL